MLRTRLIVVIIMIPILVFIAARGSISYVILITLSVGLAAWEFWRIFYNGGNAPSMVIIIGGAVLFCLQAYTPFVPFPMLVAALLMISATVHLVMYERGRIIAGLGFCVTLAGIFYWGILGSYLIHLRMLPDGLWWLLLALAAVWAADGGGYLIGRSFGKHYMTPHLSPKKTWEGYLGGVLFSLVLTAVLGALWHLKSTQVTWQAGLVLGGVIALITPFGDLTVSMFKRQFGVKDSGNLIPGHGGVMDRIDTWIWAAVIGYFLVVFFLN